MIASVLIERQQSVGGTGKESTNFQKEKFPVNHIKLFKKCRLTDKIIQKCHARITRGTSRKG